FAGTMRLGKLIVFYDDNGISIDGKVQGWFRDDTPKRFEGYGWHVIPNVDGHDAGAVEAALRAAQRETERPSLICCKTIIGWGAPNKQGTAKTHGEALGADEVAAARKQLGWTHEPFVVPEEILNSWNFKEQGAKYEASWREVFTRYQQQFPDLARELQRRWSGELPANWKEISAQAVAEAAKQTAPQATRQSSQATLNVIHPGLPDFLGGSADLTPSNNTTTKLTKVVTPEDASGNYVHYGVREFGMTAMMNGISLHGGFIPYGGTFLVFSDYARNAVRLACLMHIRSILVYTHDSIGLGEDGPTHQPIEHLASLRAMPNMMLWRPCDAVETAVAWVAAVERRDGPTALALTRQNVPQQPRTEAQKANIRRGGYVLIDSAGSPEAIVIATGSEVGIAAEAVSALNSRGRRIRLVSMPSTEAFDAQDAAYRDSVLPPAVTKRLAVEAAASQTWWKYVGLQGRVLGLDRFGLSGKGAELFPHFGFTADNVAKEIDQL
ncbi:MAG TPA: transketolase, partial [Gammaproteobacteria bacterium]|nr:transketolase [Gammaproteobacteria bacterium]